MRNAYLLVVFGLVTALFSCKTTRTHKTPQLPPVVTQLDTVTVASKDIRNYRASATKLVDLINTKLDVRFDWEKQYLLGKAEITLKPHFYPQSTVTLDAKGMELKNVMLEEQGKQVKANYTYDSLQLKITLPKAYTHNDTITIYIDYVAKPNELKEGGSAAITSDKGLYFINPLGKEPNKPKQIWTQGETESNSCWFPTIDKPNQRMTQEITITVPDSFVTLSNGLLIKTAKNSDGTRSDTWKQSLPHPPYLVMMEVAKMAVVRDKWRNIPVDYYVEEKYAPYAKDIFGKAPEMLEYFSNLLGFAYPWEKYSQIVARDYVSGAMENTTANLYFAEIQRTPKELKDKNYDYIVAHELFHQWFGDLVTTESWSNLTLNEGFANYGEYLWIDHKQGHDEAEHHRKNEKDGYFNETMLFQEPLIRFYYDDREAMFDAHSYNKGGLVINMLRDYVGDTAFFAALKLYLETNKFTAVEAPQLRLAFEKTTGEDLNWFFNQWYLNAGHPVLKIGYTYNDSTKTETINITQTPSSSKAEGLVYKLPLKVDIYVAGKVQHEKITIDQHKQQFTFAVPAKPDLVNVDATKALLAIVNDSKGMDEYVYQYLHAPTYMDKQEALAYLLHHQDDEKARPVLLQVMENPFWSIRQQAANDIKLQGDSLYVDKVRKALIKIAKTDTKNTTAAEAIKTLAESKDTLLMPLYKELLKEDRSHLVSSASLDAILDLNIDSAYLVAQSFKNVVNSDVAATVSKVLSKKSNIDDQAYFENVVANVDGYGKYVMLMNYAEFLKSQEMKAMQKGTSTMEIYARYGEPWWLRYAGAKGIHTTIKALDDKITALKKPEGTAPDPKQADLQKYQDELKATLEDIKKTEKNKSLITRYKSLK